MLNASAALYLSSLDGKLLDSNLRNSLTVKALNIGRSTKCGFGFISLPRCCESMFTRPSLQPAALFWSPFACPFLSNSQHTPVDYWYACSDWRSRTDFQVSSSHYLCSKLSSCICINFLFPKVTSVYFKAAQLLFHIFQGTGVFNVIWGQHYTMDLWQGHTEMNTVCEQTLNGSLNYRVWLCCF